MTSKEEPMVDDMCAIDLATHIFNAIHCNHGVAISQPDSEVEAAPNVLWVQVPGHRGYLKVTVEPMTRKRLPSGSHS